MSVSWILCNICFNQMSPSEKPFSLTNCGHCFCAKCVQKNRCPICKLQNVVLRCLSKPLDESIGMLFNDPQAVAEEHLQTVKWRKYQLGFLERCREYMTKKCGQLQAAHNKLLERDKQMCAEYQATKKAHAELINHLNAQATRKVHFTNETRNEKNFANKREHRLPYPATGLRSVDYYAQQAAAGKGVATPSSTPRHSDYDSIGSGGNYPYLR